MEENIRTEKEDVKLRIKQIMDAKQLTAVAFAETIGVAQATISQIIRGRNMPSTDVLLRLHQRFPEIDLNWLLTGEGSHYNDDNLENTEQQKAPTVNTMISSNSLTAENGINAGNHMDLEKETKETALESPDNSDQNTVKQAIIYRDKPHKKITEIRIFYDDNTFETFHP